MALYKYLTIDTLRKVINGSIRFTQPGAFNDPFEMLPELHVPAEFGDRDISIQFDIAAPRREPKVCELDVNFESEHCNNVNSRKILASLNQTVGVLCLSRNPASLLMWSHYADEYSGAVIEFDDEHDFFQGQIDIDYREHCPKKDISAYLTDGQPVSIAELCVKSTQWGYESEVRIVRSLSNCRKVNDSGKYPIYVMDIPQECIRSIILGERTAVREQREVWQLVKDTNISMSLAAIATWGYEFRDEPIKYDLPVSKRNPMMSPRTAHIFTEDSGELGEIARWMVQNHKLSGVVNDTL